MTDYKDIIAKQREESKFVEWEGTMLEYLQLVKENTLLLKVRLSFYKMKKKPFYSRILSTASPFINV